jgi:hypothetical protein
MPLTQKYRTMHRRQRRRRKLWELKAKLAQTTDPKSKKKLLVKIERLAPWDQVLGK